MSSRQKRWESVDKAGPCQLKDIGHGAVAAIGSLVTNLDEDRRP